MRPLDYLLADKQFDTRRIRKRVPIIHRSPAAYANANHYDSVTSRQEAEAVA